MSENEARELTEPLPLWVQLRLAVFLYHRDGCQQGLDKLSAVFGTALVADMWEDVKTLIPAEVLDRCVIK